VKQERLHNILVVRTDRIGDVMLTLPVVEALKTNFPAAHVAMLLRSYTADLADGLAEVLLYDERGIPRPFFEMMSLVRSGKFDAAVVAYPRFRIALLLRLAGIPVRVGTGFRWYSFLFNRRVYEHRKTVEKHEAAYNLAMLEILGCTVTKNPRATILLSDSDRKAAREIRQRLSIADGDRLALLHPGSGGSAHSWSAAKFSQLAQRLAHNGFRVVITGGRGEEELVRRVAEEAGAGVVALTAHMQLKEFAAFIQSASIFAANSTGPLHLAAAVGTPVVGFYPPIRVMSPERWGPLTDMKKIFVPDPAQCPRCHGGTCKGATCMDQIEVEDVLKSISDLLDETRSSRSPVNSTRHHIDVSSDAEGMIGYRK
jgi:ADP-heptose:LPS heptosyltransferase